MTLSKEKIFVFTRAVEMTIAVDNMKNPPFVGFQSLTDLFVLEQWLKENSGLVQEYVTNGKISSDEALNAFATEHAGETEELINLAAGVYLFQFHGVNPLLVRT